MKARKWLETLTMMALCGMVALLAGTVHAREGWYVYRVDRVNHGLCGGHVRLTMLDGDSRFVL